ncbi:relaxase/mobilization nuclease domain-containing protein [Bacteroides xylanisolvens]|uniref:mobilization protein MbpC n=1 Tax=Bacteroides xylanisolvens TaxID=371601 RepID=UPI00125F6A6E|nr:mobilization protein MbpC [Bacteroides xylanisolvens]KAB6377836.1 relaxase/mobilization nuclease domain-containing protein [Bacteroides xylanisolvens]
METNSHPEAAASNVKQGQYSPRKRKDTTPRVNPQLAVELVYQELKRVEVYTKRIEDATARKVQIDGKSLESAENRLKNVLADFERQGYRMKNGGYVDKRISFYSILCAVISLLFACFMCYLWTDAAKDRIAKERNFVQSQDIGKVNKAEIKEAMDGVLKKMQGFDFTKFKEELGKRGFKVREARASTGKLNGYYVTARSGTEYKASEIGKGYTLAHIERTQSKLKCNSMNISHGNKLTPGSGSFQR